MGTTTGRVRLALPQGRRPRSGLIPRRHGRHGDRPPDHQGDHRRRHRRPHPGHGPLGRRPGRRGGPRLRPHLHPPLLRRPPRPRRPARPPHGDVRHDHPPRRPPPGRAVHGPGRRPGHQRPPADPGPALHAADDDRQLRPLPDLPDRDGLAVDPAHPGRPGGGPGPVVDREALPLQAAPRHLVRPGPGRRRRGRGRRRRQRRTRGQGLRPGGPGDREAQGGRPPPLRGPPAHDPLQLEVHPGPPGRPRPRPGRDAGRRRLARGPRSHHARHLRRLLHLPRPARRPGPHARHGPHGRPAGPRRHRARPGTDRHRAVPEGRHQGTPRRRPGHRRVRRRRFRLRPRPRQDQPGSRRPELRDPRRRDPRGRRLLRLGQVHRLPAPAALLRRHPRRRPHRRSRRPRAHPGLAAVRDRPGPRGLLPVLGHGPEQHRVRPSRGDAGGGREGRPRRPGGPFHRRAPPGLRHQGRRTRPHPLRRPASARRARPRDPHRPAPARPGRRHLRRGRAGRARDPRGPEAGHGGPHDPPHRPPPLHPEPRRPHRRPGERPPRRPRHPRGAPAPVAPLPPPAHRPRRPRWHLPGPRPPGCRTSRGRGHLRT